MKFNPDVVKEGTFDADSVMNTWGGNCEFEHEHAKYWPALVKLTEENRRRWMSKWRELGGVVGIKEWDYKQGTTVELGEKAEVEVEAVVDSKSEGGGEAEVNGKIESDGEPAPTDQFDDNVEPQVNGDIEPQSPEILVVAQ